MPSCINPSNRNLLDELLLVQERELYSSIELLDWDENTLKEIVGRVSSGTISIDGGSAVRRTLNLSVVSDSESYNITEVSNDISVNKKFRAFVGLKNVTGYKEAGDIIWFQLGIFVLTDVQISNSLDGVQINITALDKMSLLSGDVAGQSETPMNYGVYKDIVGGEEVEKSFTYFEIIRHVVSTLGGEHPGKVVINNVPIYGKQVVQAQEAIPAIQGESLDPEKFYYRYFKLGPTEEGELIKDAGTPYQAVLEDIKNKLGNYEYFYDVYGNFIFQEKRNFLNSSPVDILDLIENSYLPNYDNTSYIYNFIGKNIIQSYNNVPDMKNIKNNFYVYGLDGICYHLAIDKKPKLFSSEHPWQYEIVRLGDQIIANNPLNYQHLIPRWYTELKTFFVYDDTTKRGIYNPTTKLWRDKFDDSGNVTWTKRGNPSYWDYYFDLIDETSSLGVFSIDNIGKRTKVVNDEDIKDLYYPKTENIVVFSQEEAVASNEYYQNAINSSQPYVIISNDNLKKVKPAIRQNRKGKEDLTRGSKSAWDEIRNLLYFHTSYNEVINITSLPLYFLDVNNKILAQDEKSNIAGDYFVNSISIPLGIEGLMSLNGIRVISRI